MSTQTGLEASAGTSFTGRDADEATFLSSVQSASTHPMTITSIGASVNSRTLRMVEVGAGPVAIAFVGLQHATEPAGREGMLTFLRDLTLDSAWSTFLASNRLVFIPTMNPDSFNPSSLDGEGSTRDNANGANLNRDHLLFHQQPETVALHDALRGLRPRIIIDLHEHAGTQTSRGEMEALWVKSLNVPSTFANLNAQMVDTDMAAAVVAATYTYDEYPSGSTPGALETLRGAATGYAAFGVLLETRRLQDTATFRTELQRFCCDYLTSWYADNKAAVDSETTTVKESAAPATFVLRGDTENAATATLDPTPAGYRLTQAQRDTVDVQLATFGISPYRDGTEWVVPVDREGWTRIPHLFDADAWTESSRVAATRLAQLPALRSVVRGGLLVPSDTGVIRDGTFVPA